MCELGGLIYGWLRAARCNHASWTPYFHCIPTLTLALLCPHWCCDYIPIFDSNFKPCTFILFLIVNIQVSNFRVMDLYRMPNRLDSPCIEYNRIWSAAQMYRPGPDLCNYLAENKSFQTRALEVKSSYSCIILVTNIVLWDNTMITVMRLIMPNCYSRKSKQQVLTGARHGCSQHQWSLHMTRAVNRSSRNFTSMGVFKEIFINFADKPPDTHCGRC